jgi:hypothetical protein
LLEVPFLVVDDRRVSSEVRGAERAGVQELAALVEDDGAEIGLRDAVRERQVAGSTARFARPMTISAGSSYETYSSSGRASR